MHWDVAAVDETNLTPVFLDLARKAAALNPSVASNWDRLAHCLIQTGAVEEALVVLAEAVTRCPDDPNLYLRLAYAHFLTGRSDAARQVLDQAPAVPIEDPKASLNRLDLIMLLHPIGEAVRTATDILARDPTNQDALSILAKGLRNTANPEHVIPFCRAALEHEPGHTCARYVLAVALALLGRSDEARKLIDLDQFITVVNVPTPEGYARADAFESAAAGEIIRNPTLKRDPINKATKGGFQTIGRLPCAGDRAIPLVLDRIRAAVDAFESNLPDGHEDAFVKSRPSRAWLRAWAVVYSGDGRQVSHMHPNGWLSGVYYVSAPEASRDHPRGGCLVLGSLQDDGTGDPPWGLRDIHPVPGRLILFPSYVPHATIPTRSVDRRICVSFDVVPAGTCKPQVG
jgi:tetratricopeptide (TPR) repeat protein